MGGHYTSKFSKRKGPNLPQNFWLGFEITFRLELRELRYGPKEIMKLFPNGMVKLNQKSNGGQSFWMSNTTWVNLTPFPYPNCINKCLNLSNQSIKVMICMDILTWHVNKDALRTLWHPNIHISKVHTAIYSWLRPTNDQAHWMSSSNKSYSNISTSDTYLIQSIWTCQGERSCLIKS